MSFLSSIPIWGWFDIGFTFLVLVALCGEWEWLARRLIPDRQNDLLSAESTRKKLKKICEFILIVGIAGEFSCLPFSLYESAKLNDEAATARKEADDAKLTNTKLRAQIEPRRLTGAQKAFLASAVNITNLVIPDGFPRDWKPSTLIVSPIFDNESADFADDFASALKMAGWYVRTDRAELNAKYGVHLKISPAAPPNLPGLKQLKDALRALDIPYDAVPITDEETGNINEKQIANGGIYFFVEHKPPPEN